MVLESISSVSTANVATPTQFQPIINPQSSTNGVETLQTDPDSVVITLSESQNTTNNRNNDTSGTNENNFQLPPSVLNNILTSNLSVRLTYDAPLSRSFLEIINTSTERIILRFPSKNFVNFINELLDR